MEGVHEDIMAAALAAFASNDCTVKAFLSRRISKSRGNFFDDIEIKDTSVQYVTLETRQDWEDVASAVKAAEPDILYFNTFQRDGIAKWARQFDKPIVGIVHNPHLFTAAPECMELLKEGRLELLCLGHHVLDYVRTVLSGYEDKIHLYLPYLWMREEFDRFALPEGDDPLRIVLPGAIDYNNRDFKGLVSFLQESAATLPRDVVFYLVAGGPNRADLEQLVDQAGLGDMFCFLPLDPETKRVPHRDYLRCLYASHAMMLLLPVGREDYVTTKITTGVPASIGTGRPIIAPQSVGEAYGFAPQIVPESRPFDISKTDLSNDSLARARDAMTLIRRDGLMSNSLVIEDILQRQLPISDDA